MSHLQEELTNYLCMRRNLGFKLSDAGRGLSFFVSFLEKQAASHITTQLALQWAQSTSVSPQEWARCLGYVRGFARYLSAIDPSNEIPSVELLPYKPKRARPYLYSEQEVEQLLAEALCLPPKNGLRGLTYHCLFGLLIVSGLRISEALNLKVEDVDLDNGILIVLGSKFGKSRLVPLHPSTQKVLRDYRSARDRIFKKRAAIYFFVNSKCNRLDGGDVRRTFYSISRQIGLRGKESSTGPRIHDFRHRMATQTLLQWYRSGINPESRLPVLAAYLGHVHVSDTYWYLTACPELMEEAVQCLERRGR